jgi:hypothetical protein
MRRLPHLAVAVAVLAALSAPAALASRGPSGSGCTSASAACVYTEGGFGTGGSKPGKLSSRLARSIGKYGGKDRRLLQVIASPGIFGHPEPSGAGPVNGSSVLGAILDLGAGPLALLAALLGGAAALGVNGALRRRRAGRP